MESSIKIKNNSSSWSLNQPLYLRVARPNTEESARQKQNDWFFRCQKEFENVQRNHGSAWFPTLTFNNANLPRLYLADYLDTLPIIPKTKEGSDNICYNSEPFTNINPDDYIDCFNINYVRTFVKSLRKILERKGYNLCKWQYVICAEYGSKTQRPHYHALIFIPYAAVSQKDMLDALRRAWHYGFIGHGKRGLCVESTHAIRYATKYVSKDMYFHKAQKFKRLGVSLDHVINHQTTYEPKVLRKMLYDFMPRMVVSHGLGRCFFDDYLSQLEESYLMPYLTKEKTFALPLDKGNQFTLPQYYINKFCYEINKDLSKYFDKTIAILTPLGKKVYSRKLGLRLSATERQLDVLTPQICGDLYSSIFSVPKQELAQYITYFRYLPYLGTGDITPNHVFRYSSELMWSICFDRKENHYIVEKEYDDNCVFIDNLEVGSSCAELMYEYALDIASEKMPQLIHNYGTWSDQECWSAYEKAAVAYDKYMDRLFEQKENDKRAKRERKASAKHECLIKMPHLISTYESI